MKRKKIGVSEKPAEDLESILVFSAAVFMLFFAYAIIRYNVFKGVALSALPIYVSNKAIALTAVSLLGFAGILGPLARLWPVRFASKLYTRKYFGLFGFGLAVIHALMSLLLFGPQYYPKFFAASGKLTLYGEISMLFGILAFIVFGILIVLHVVPAERLLEKRKMRVIRIFVMPAFVLVSLHVFFMGIENWLKPAEWPGGLLPVSMIAFAILAGIISIRLLLETPKQ